MLVRGRCDTVITMNSEDYRAALRYSLARERVIASEGVGIRSRPLDTPADKIRRELSSDGCTVIAFVGELSRRKNQAFIIRCLPRIRERFGNALLWLVGEGSARDDLSHLARKLQVDDAVKFLGYREDAMDIMRACDLYVSASLVEGMPLNVIEAMSVGKTVLASRIKGHSDLISDGFNGYLYDPFDEEEFVDKACRILSGGMLDPSRISNSVKEYGRSGAVERILSIFLEEIPGL
jgi:glycosyltransferase EpsD